MPKKKNDAAKAKLKAQKHKKAAKKGEKLQQKKQTKTGERIDTEDDLIRTLEELRLQYEEEHKVTIAVVETPSRRANASFLPCPVSGDLWFFGGELFDGRTATFFNDLFRYNPDKHEWKRITSPNAPGPRSAHQMISTTTNGGKLWLFGGEFASSNQTAFHHYRDLWAFDIPTLTWERFDTRLRPSARSDRMALYKHYIVLFGGFHDTGIRTNYLCDLWLFDLDAYEWREIVQKDIDRRPLARSGFSFLPCAEGVVLHGGYRKDYTGKRAKGVALADTWLLRLDALQPGIGFSSADVKWEKRKRIGYVPCTRSGVTAAYWSNRQMGVLFGGVYDEDVDEETLKSVFFNDGLYGYQLAGNGRWISLNIKKAKVQKRRRRTKQHAKVPADGGSDEEDGDEGNDDPENQAPADNDVPTDDEEEDKSIPCKRYNAMLAIQRNVLYLYGGCIETEEQEGVLSDFWSLDLTKMVAWKCLQESLIIWNNDDEGDDGIDIKDDSDSDSSSEGDSEKGDEVQPEMEEDAAVILSAATEGATENAELRQKAAAFLATSKAGLQGSEEERLSTPLPGDSLRSFYERSREYYTQKAHETSDNRGKLLRRDGFQLAEERYDEYKPILEEIKKIQASAGLDEAELQQRNPANVTAESRNRR